MKCIDLFAGLGGFSEGARMAGCKVVWAANHWEASVLWHKVNHAGTEHYCQDLHQADWTKVPRHNVMLASPACQGFTDARGKNCPRHDVARTTAWATVSCMEVHRPELGIVENVPKFLQWKLFPAWKMAMEALGYAVSPHLLDAADFGVPQHRVRVFIILSKSKAPIQLKFEPQSHVPVSSVIRWDTHPWSPIEKPGRAKATLERIARGRKEFGDTFVAPFYGSGSGMTGRSIDRPLGTVTTRDRWLLVRGDHLRMFQPDEYRDIMGFPQTYKLPGQRTLAIHLLGNAVCPPVPAAILTRLNQRN